MLYLIVADNTRGIQINTLDADKVSENEYDDGWYDEYGQVVLGTVCAENYGEALKLGRKVHGIECIDAYALAE